MVDKTSREEVEGVAAPYRANYRVLPKQVAGTQG
jgi:hypothetical protein